MKSKRIGLFMILFTFSLLMMACSSEDLEAEGSTLSTELYTGIQLIKWNGEDYEKENIDDFSLFLESADQPVFLDFWAQWCPACRMSSSFIESLSKEFDERAYIVKIDVDEKMGLDISQSYAVRGLPTFVLIRDGEEIDRVVGYDKTFEYLISEMIENGIQ